MTGAELKTFTESLLDGQTIDKDLFYILANVARVRIEEERNWKILETDNTSQTSSPGDTFLTMKTLPTDFGNMIKVFTVDSDNNQLEYRPCSFAERYAYKDAMMRYYIDLANGQFALTGNKSKSTTIHLIYCKTSTDIAEATSWAFPSRFHAILGFMVAEMHKAGVDYDQTNALQAVQHRADAKVLWESMILWDTNIRLKEMNNQYGGVEAYDRDGLPVDGGSFETPLGLM